MSEYVDLPDIFGSVIFCDDIRIEQSGKFIYVGVYQGVMLVHTEFPIKLPKFGVAVSIMQRVELFVPSIKLAIFLPGDADDNASILADIKEASSGDFARRARANSDLAGIEQVEREWVSANSNLMFESFEIKQPGMIKVRAEIGSRLCRLGSLSVGSASKK